MNELEVDERRLPGGDRRRRPTPMLSRYTLWGRRRNMRRASEMANSYVDRYGFRVAAVLAGILILCVLDAVFTLLYLQKGGGELNPLMRRAIEAGTGPFIAIKCGLTIAGILFLALHKNFRFVKGLIAGVLGFYLLLLGYHLYLASVT
ncbi:MAG: DUF5658 family protein [Planctomycetes bacterium]|nr:DUF5658 family protein [Planctomycetota bacterium]